MSLNKKISLRTKKRVQRVRSRLKGITIPRVSVFRSLNSIYAQIIDDNQHKTLASYSSRDLKNKAANKTDAALSVGKELAQRALKLGITSVVFDRGPYLYHGRVKSLAEGLRSGGIKI